MDKHTADIQESKQLTNYADRSNVADINSNITAKIENPLKGIPHDELLRQVEEFARRENLTEFLPELQKGALVAQSPGEWDNIPELDQSDRDALEYELFHKWKQPKDLWLTVILCSVGAAVQGWDQTGSNAANLTFPVEFGINPVVGTADYDRNNWLVGLVNSAPYMCAALVGCWLSHPLNYYFGRRGTIFFSACFCFIAPIGSAFTQNWPQLFICRVLLGVGLGCKASIVPVFSAESAPASIRGALNQWQLWTALGIWLGNTANLILFSVGSIAWRLQVGSAFLPSIPLLIGVFFCPESPRWYMKKGRYQDAWKSLCRLRNARLLAGRDLYYVHAQLALEAQLVRSKSYPGLFIELFTIPRNRRASLASFTVMIGQQMCGINIVAFFSSSVFVQAGASNFTALLISFGTGIIGPLCATVSMFYLDTFGRRNLLLCTFPNMAWTLLAAGFCFYIPISQPAHLDAIAFFIFLFSTIYSFGEGPVPFLYSAEVFPLSHREVGNAFAVSVNNFFASILSLTFFRIEAAFGYTGAFGFYAGLNVIAFIMIFLWMPETKQRTLEELDYVFGIPTTRFMSYQVFTALPYYIRKYFLFQWSAKLKPLYQLDEVADESIMKSKLNNRRQAV